MKHSLLLAFSTFTLSAFGFGQLAAQPAKAHNRIPQLCAAYTAAGDLLKATISEHHLKVSIERRTGPPLELIQELPQIQVSPNSDRAMKRCGIAVSAKADNAAVAISFGSQLLVQLINLANGSLAHTLEIPAKFEFEVPLMAVGYLGDSDRLAVGHVHYRPTAEPEIAVETIDPSGLSAQSEGTVLGPQYSEVFGSDFNFERGLIWFSCPGYSAKIDRQPRCTLTSALLLHPRERGPVIPPPPDDRVIGSGQPVLEFPTPDTALLLAANRLWLYTFGSHSFKQLNLVETPHFIQWFEFPRAPKFSSDVRFAAIPVDMYHSPFFREGQVSHGTKILIVKVPELQIVDSIQPPDRQPLVDFALRSDQTNVTLVANWGKQWQTFKVPSKPAAAKPLSK